MQPLQGGFSRVIGMIYVSIIFKKAGDHGGVLSPHRYDEGAIAGFVRGVYIGSMINECLHYFFITPGRGNEQGCFGLVIFQVCCNAFFQQFIYQFFLAGFSREVQ